jgi:heat shock protein HslJ
MHSRVRDEPTNMRRITRYLELIGAMVLAMASVAAGMAQAAVPAQLSSGEWVVESVGGERRAHIAFAVDGKVTGSGGCNRLTGRAEISGDSITFGAIATTRMACAPNVMQQERKLLDALAAARSYHIADIVLTLHDAPGVELIRLTRKT